MRSQPFRVQQIALPAVQRNGFYAHSENILVAMITDQNDLIKDLGLRRVLKARKQKTETGKGLRLFNIPKIDFDAKAYYELIDWQNVQITPPLLLLDVTNDEIERAVTDGIFLGTLI